MKNSLLAAALAALRLRFASALAVLRFRRLSALALRRFVLRFSLAGLAWRSFFLPAFFAFLALAMAGLAPVRPVPVICAGAKASANPTTAGTIHRRTNV